MKVEPGQVVNYNGYEYVVMLIYGKKALISPIVGDKRIEVNIKDLNGIIRISPRQKFFQELASA